MKRVGIIGGGQLGKMMILDGKRLDTVFVILDPTKGCPAASIADKHIIAEFDDDDAIMELAKEVDVVTYEFEHISLNALRKLEKANYKVYPSADTLSHIQNKYEQKKWLEKHGIAVPKFIAINSYEELGNIKKHFPFPVMLKACTGGYDGKGNALINSKYDIDKAYNTLGHGKLSLMAEECIDFVMEISVLACRNISGDITVFPVAENVHNNSILDETLVPARINKEITKKAMEVSRKCIEIFENIGMLCVELFVTKEGEVLVNELAPRPHNSGHYTIEGCYTSQYEQHIRAILGYPLGNAELIRPTVMKNIIGKHSAEANVLGYNEAYKYLNAKIHIYGKKQVSKGRKMGHITATGNTLEEALTEVRGAWEAVQYE